jgi:hypothetical protein
MKLLAIALCLILLSATAYAATYQWTDETGGLNFTDNPDRIPAKYKDQAREVTVESPPPMKFETPPATEAAPSRSTAGVGDAAEYCGRNGLSWQGRFRSLRQEQQHLAKALPELEKEVRVMRTKYITRTGQDSHYKQKKEYLEKSDEFTKAKTRKEDVDQQLTDLEGEADRCGVPFPLRK